LILFIQKYQILKKNKKNSMNNKIIDNYLKQHDGNHSLLYSDVYIKLIQNNFHKLPVEHMFECFPEFMFFEEDYLKIKRIINSNRLKSRNIIDIGCQYGIQSEIFLDMSYTGIDSDFKYNINSDLDNINFIYDTFPSKNISLKNSIVISNMSLGWYGDETDFSDDLKEADIIFISSNKATIYSLKKIYKYHYVYNKNQPSTFDRHLFSNQEILHIPK